MDEHALSPDRFSEISKPRLQKFYSYWLARKGSRRFPSRRDIDPLEFGYLLPDMMLVDVLRVPMRFRVRVHGTEMVRRAHYDLTGKLLDDLPTTDYRNYVIERCRQLVETGEPTLVHYNRMLDGRHHRHEAIWLPLSEDGVSVTQLICGLVYEPASSGKILVSSCLLPKAMT
jgi:hypothetical protein